ncbi:hypothetical protein Pse7367_3274 [Thalassoporum mexicanum PCC 7367]|uniref:hypothetical protein n=1 Tax=Thalassoporum mexicanum TaxID=3457544 RepID=UPI00029FF9D0|nr:hypothetical protein [Pseudanabaena sp. PCC 7367]AFY71515.1 hypothetical protein Pse7367_3274 [Pseudanabaena sp. PCC 7367]
MNDEEQKQNLQELRQFAGMMGGTQIFTEHNFLSLISPKYAGRSIRDLSEEELKEVMELAAQMPVLDDDDDD